jgi:hypothetical protein
MHISADKVAENKTEPIAGKPVAQNKTAHRTYLTDNRPTSATQRKFREMANNSPGAKRAAAFQAMAAGNTQAIQLKSGANAATPSVADTGNFAAGEKPVQAKSDPIQRKEENNTGLPDHLKTGIENLSGQSLSDVKVHYNSDKPAQLNALAYTQGTNIHVAAGQEQHLAHEAWHVVQQKQGRVKPTLQMKPGVPVNDDKGLEKEADVMGVKATGQQTKAHPAVKANKCACSFQLKTSAGAPLQFIKIYKLGHDNDEEHILADTDKAVPDTDTIVAWSAAEIDHALLKLNEKKGEKELDQNESEFSQNLRSAKNRKLRIAKNRADFVSATAGSYIRNQHKRVPGVWKHWVEPPGAVHNFADNQPLLTPKDASGGNKVHHMQYNANDKLGEESIRNMAVIASHEGFKLQVTGTRGDLEGLKRNLKDHWAVITPVVISSPPDEWAEDSGEYLKGQRTGIPTISTKKGLQEAIETGRADRNYKPQEKWSGLNYNRNPGNEVGTNVHEDGKQKHKIAEAKARQRDDKIVAFKSYLEGGNVLSGTDLRLQPFALVGKDVLAATRHLVDPDLSDIDIHKIVADDLGLPVASVVFVEQPGQFHLDMGLVILGQGHVILNDSSQTYALMRRWLAEDKESVLRAIDALNEEVKKENKTIRERNEPYVKEHRLITEEEVENAFTVLNNTLNTVLGERHRLEEMAANDLKKAGINVTRLPASFPRTSFTPEMNFLNGESGVGPDKRSFFITNGGDARAEDAVAAAYFAAVESTQLARIYFVDSQTSEDSFRKGGGIGCRDKTECDDEQGMHTDSSSMATKGQEDQEPAKKEDAPKPRVSVAPPDPELLKKYPIGSETNFSYFGASGTKNGVDCIARVTRIEGTIVFVTVTKMVKSGTNTEYIPGSQSPGPQNVIGIEFSFNSNEHATLHPL